MLETWRGLGRYGPTDDVVFSRVAEIRNDLVTKPSIELTPDDISYSKYLESLVKQLDYQEEMDQVGVFIKDYPLVHPLLILQVGFSPHYICIFSFEKGFFLRQV